jgi:hypothetical protein
MDDLSQALQSLQATLQERGWGNDTSPMPPLGSMNADGKQNTPMVALTSTASQIDQAKSNEPSRPSPTSSPSGTQKPIRDCKDSKNQLTTLLAQAHLLLKGYGEKAEDAASRDAGFQWLLGRFTIDQVRAAFRTYIERNADLPVPANIINLIEPPPQKLSSAVYVAYQKKACSGGWLLSDERQFCRDYEAQEMEAGRASRELLECHREIEASKQKAFDIGYEGQLD